MKRIIAFTFALIMLLSLCSCESNTIRKNGEFNPDMYVSEAQLSIFINLVNLNQYYYNEVFVNGHLAVDETKATEKDGKTWAPVTDEKFASYDALVAELKAAYTDEAVEAMLADYPVYADIDGVLCYDISAEQTAAKHIWVLDEDREIELEKRTDEGFTIEFRFADQDKPKHDELEEFTFIRVGNGVNEGYRMTEFVNVH